MKKHVLGSLVLGAVMALASFAAHADDTIKFGVAAEPYPPFSSKDASGKWVGFEIDLMDAVCAQMKAKCELVETAWDGIIPSLQEKKIDVIWSSMSITAERKQKIDFTDKYYQTPAVIIGPKSRGGEDRLLQSRQRQGEDLRRPDLDHPRQFRAEVFRLDGDHQDL